MAGAKVAEFAVRDIVDSKAHLRESDSRQVKPFECAVVDLSSRSLPLFDFKPEAGSFQIRRLSAVSNWEAFLLRAPLDWGE
jgi:hypothetical protein